VIRDRIEHINDHWARQKFAEKTNVELAIFFSSYCKDRTWQHKSGTATKILPTPTLKQDLLRMPIFEFATDKTLTSMRELRADIAGELGRLELVRLADSSEVRADTNPSRIARKRSLQGKLKGWSVSLLDGWRCGGSGGEQDHRDGRHEVGEYNYFERFWK
jgi:hypothetical protein